MLDSINKKCALIILNNIQMERKNIKGRRASTASLRESKNILGTDRTLTARNMYLSHFHSQKKEHNPGRNKQTFYFHPHMVNVNLPLPHVHFTRIIKNKYTPYPHTQKIIKETLLKNENIFKNGLIKQLLAIKLKKIKT
ncbi:hypothetical protein [Enterovibrio norvegicus]|uniref:hypothetical protein n=1 Tax=Enterovibrio norvegicus TaxID=188144 RepID=UPI000CA8D902|nr:hypothetical protein [Enterovibrio norvegicus]PMI30498.1 hypothetical protein BCU47_17690 [Enterovibrio norvegicus]